MFTWDKIKPNEEPWFLPIFNFMLNIYPWCKISFHSKWLNSTIELNMTYFLGCGTASRSECASIRAQLYHCAHKSVDRSPGTRSSITVWITSSGQRRLQSWGCPSRSGCWQRTILSWSLPSKYFGLFFDQPFLSELLLRSLSSLNAAFLIYLGPHHWFQLIGLSHYEADFTFAILQS